MKGAFSHTSFSKGEVVYVPKGKVSTKPTQTSIQVSKNIHINIEDEGQYINHSCVPNCKMINGKLVAISGIQPNEEITFNYNDSEDILSSPFVCNCCGKWIKGRLGN